MTLINISFNTSNNSKFTVKARSTQYYDGETGLGLNRLAKEKPTLEQVPIQPPSLLVLMNVHVIRSV